MSVPEGLRHKGKLEVHVKAERLASYTLKILSNPKRFNPEIDEELIKRIKNCALDIYTKAWAANGFNAETSQEDRRIRYRLQLEALAGCTDMLAYIGVAKSVFHIREKRMKYWRKSIKEVKKLLQNWKESDVKRYGKPQL